MKQGRSNKSAFSVHNKNRMYEKVEIVTEGKERRKGPMAKLAESLEKSEKNLKKESKKAKKKLKENDQVAELKRRSKENMTKKEWLRQRNISNKKFSRDPEGTVRNYAKQHASDVKRAGQQPVSGNEEEDTYNDAMAQLKGLKESGRGEVYLSTTSEKLLSKDIDIDEFRHNPEKAIDDWVDYVASRKGYGSDARSEVTSELLGEIFEEEVYADLRDYDKSMISLDGQPLGESKLKKKSD
jgi:hypothetical protein